MPLWFGLSACKPAAPKKQVVVYSPHGQEILDEFGAAFHAAHPDIEFVGRFVSPLQVLSQLRIDTRSPKIDVWWGGTSAFFSQGVAENLLQPYRPSWADASKTEYHDAKDFWYAQFLQVPAVMFNSNIYKVEDIPKSWAELLDPKWKDKIVIREPMDSGTMKTIYSGIIWRLGGAEHKSDAGYDFLKKLDAQTKSYLPNPQALYDRIGKSSEGYISLWNVTDIIFQAKANGYPFGFRVFEDPVPLSVDPIGIIAGAPHSEEAKLFYEFVTSKENCVKLAKEHYRILARTDISKDDLPAEMNAIQFQPMDISFEAFDKLQNEWMETWRKTIRNPEK